MHCVVEDKRVAEAVAGDEAKTSELSVVVIKSLREKLRIVLAAPDVETLSSWKSLGFQQNGTNAKIWINEDWVMQVKITSAGGELQMNVFKLEHKAEVAA